MEVADGALEACGVTKPKMQRAIDWRVDARDAGIYDGNGDRAPAKSAVTHWAVAKVDHHCSVLDGCVVRIRQGMVEPDFVANRESAKAVAEPHSGSLL
jgi:hypothetical protein